MLALLRKTLNSLKAQVMWPELGLATLSLLPLIIAACYAHNLLFLKLGLISISLFIAANRVKYHAPVICLHFLLILFTFSLLYWSIHCCAIIFVTACALMAFGCVYITQLGDKLRTLGNYTFIPAVYLACEIQYSVGPQAWRTTYWQFLKITPLALASVLLLYYACHNVWATNSKKISILSKSIKHYWLIHDSGTISRNWLPSSIAIFIGVFIAASLAVLGHIASPEWLIWSTASVISAELIISRMKFIQRIVGALVGITVGLSLCPFIAQTPLTYSLAVLGIMLTLTCFKRYFLSFSSRCFFITLAAYAISHSEHLALIRIQNIFLGGIIGILSLYFSHSVLKKMQRQHNKHHVDNGL